MTDMALTVASLVKRHAGGRRLDLGIFARRGTREVEALLAQGHRTIVMGDRFRFLYRLSRRLSGAPGRCLFVETTLDDLPVAPFALDAMVLLGGLPSRREPGRTLARMRAVTKAGGIVLFPHPVVDGKRGGLARVAVPVRPGVMGPVERSRLCLWTMAAGFAQVGQRRPTGTGVAPWVVTAAVAGPRESVVGGDGFLGPDGLDSL